MNKVGLISLLLVPLILAGACRPQARSEAQENWIALDSGLELGRFVTPRAEGDVEGEIVILRIDPAAWRLVILCADELEQSNLSAAQWAAKYDLAAATNAGMFATDYSRHVGYLKNHDHVNSDVVTDYQSVASFDPTREDLPPFRIHDLDAPGISLDAIKADYGCVVQNLRLVKRPGENRWSRQERMWSEMALGEDARGRALFIFCRQPHSMHDFNNLLLDLPIDLVCAQHLEGGPEAQLFVDTERLRLEAFGSFETGFLPDDSNRVAWPLPNVIGIRKRAEDR